MAGEGRTALGRGWTTGACAAAAARTAYTARLTGRFPDPASFRLPHGGSASFLLALATISGKTAVEVAIVDRQGDFLARVGG